MDDLPDDLDFDEITEGDFDDIDMSELIAAAEIVEQEHRSGQISFVSNDDDPIPPEPLPEDTPSFHPIDIQNLCTWIYPVNYPVRGYQLNIVQKALFHNTLVALPTGLGKTFIAAVVMYNYWRWFPNSKIIFMAPTRPLVDQQIEACFYICGLPQSDTCDMTGSTTPAARRELWKTKRVFFATPQTIQKDIISNACPVEKVVCIVVDEAHKATGNYAYTDVVRRISKKQQDFRVLALTATPGSNLDAVQDVISNLKITNVQVRTEDSMDIREFSHGKNVQNIIVRLNYTEGASGDLPSIISRFRDSVFKPVLIDLSKKPTNVTADPDQWSAFRLRSTRMHFSATAKNYNKNLMFLVVSTFLMAESLSRSYELLCAHGVAPFLESLELIMEELEEKKQTGKKLTVPQNTFYNNSVVRRLIEELTQKLQRPDFVGHPKMERLLSILISHFDNLEHGKASKVMIFSSFRSSVMDICRILSRHQPLIRATYFVGQATSKKGAKGLKQTEQQDVIQKFKSDNYNVLVSTSIGEEGLDIGEVDLIICYDSQTSPIRMLQRMGRTGRQRRGKCILLMTESEEKKFAQAKDAYAKIQRLITQPGMITYHKPNPAVLPPNYKPTIHRKVVTIGSYQPKLVKRKRTAGRDRSMISAEGTLTERARELLVSGFGAKSIQEVMTRYWPLQGHQKSLNKYVPLHLSEKPCYRIGHSRRTADFVGLVQRMEHRILHPGEEVASKQQQTKLVLPKRQQQTKLILPKRNRPPKKPSAYDETRRLSVDDLDFQAFMDKNDVSLFVDTYQEDVSRTDEAVEQDQLKERSREERLVDVLSRKEADEEESFEDILARDRKGKSRMIEQEENVTSSESWEALLPSSFYTDQATEKQGESSKTTEPTKKNDDSDIPLLDSEGQDEKDSNHSHFDDIDFDNHLELLEPVEEPEQPVKQEKPVEIVKNMKPLGPLVHAGNIQPELSSMTQALAYEGYFDDYLAPCFPFEKNEITTTATCIVWAKPVPEFSARALELLKARQTKLKEITGRFVTVSVLSEPRMKPEQMETETPTLDDDDDEVRLLLTMSDKKDLVSVEKKEAKPVDNKEEDESVVEFDFDLFSNMDEFDIADLIENRIDEEQSTFRPFEMEQTTQPKKLSSQAMLYYQKEEETGKEAVKAKKEEEHNLCLKEIQEEEDDNLIMFDFENMTQDSSQASVTEVVDEEQAKQDSSSSFPLPRNKQARINLDDEDEEDEIKCRSRENSGSSLLMQLSTGQYKSPLRNNTLGSPTTTASPLRRTTLAADESPSPIIRRRRRRMVSEDSVDGMDVPAKRHKLVISDEDDEDEQHPPPPRRESLMKRLLGTGKKNSHKYTKDDRLGNPFIDDEAEKSSDGGHTSEEEEEEGNSILDSFIDDDSNSRLSSQSSLDNTIYRQSLAQQQSHGRHWLDRINLEKYQQQDGEEDEIVGETDESIIEEFSSDLAPNENNIAVSSDDDFM
ncbi:hypothetical protein G6F46_003133 [Rhizopus delemar]|uniref:ATP-dependent DNA helicase n=2 Tax=Rhizopus TaxID=4842 RepID=A0A9P7CT51_9FUNG|nr:hypothetical protein G6F55_000710 [Rhizopus delemar]KAG1550420.1 hypothetical protein G6F51_002465 [Rhizopus arrhizus]KAG1502205.1 hypothetical protein G6F54_002518 [Rhizopus delemar]KAG1515720.1 hypothetical protein G6F53_002703 [Rhizopus delemar]KAG1528679.1 hypothetical protein G6F52_000427 [Rhizopus delemar]